MKTGLKERIGVGIVLGALAVESLACSGYNLRMSSVMVDRKEGKDVMVGWGSLGKGGDYIGIGILNVALDNPWHRKIMPIYNSHREKEAPKETPTTLQFGSFGYAEGPCFQLGEYLSIRSNESQWYAKVSPLIGWHKDVEKK